MEAMASQSADAHGPEIVGKTVLAVGDDRSGCRNLGDPFSIGQPGVYNRRLLEQKEAALEHA